MKTHRKWQPRPVDRKKRSIPQALHPQKSTNGRGSRRKNRLNHLKQLVLSIFLRRILSAGLALVAVLMEIQFFHFSGQAPALPSKSVSFVRVP